MISIPKTEIKDYCYDLPPDRIAPYPVCDRDHSKLLVYRSGEITDDIFYHIDRYLPDRCLLVWNDTRVIRARLNFVKATGAAIEVFLLEPFDPPEYHQAFSATAGCSWRCLVGNAGKWKSGKLSMPVPYRNSLILLEAEKQAAGGGEYVVHFRWNSSGMSFGELLELAGSVPIPPYLNRVSEAVDSERYQTVYAEIPGSVAAPTAGLHITAGVTSRLQQTGIRQAGITLHVGAGTFRPIREEDVSAHPMHTEAFSVYYDTVKTLLEHRGPVVATGTTTVRTLESLYWLGMHPEGLQNGGRAFHLDQWMPYQEKTGPSAEEALTNLLEWMERNSVRQLKGSTALMIVPGYRFRMVQGLITNFHMPRSSLLLLIAAFIGDQWKRVYSHALGGGYRFLSYGDSSLLLP